MISTNIFFGYKCDRCNISINIGVGNQGVSCPSCHGIMVADNTAPAVSTHVTCSNCKSYFGMINTERCPNCNNSFS